MDAHKIDHGPCRVKRTLSPSVRYREGSHAAWLEAASVTALLHVDSLTSEPCKFASARSPLALRSHPIAMRHRTRGGYAPARTHPIAMRHRTRGGMHPLPEPTAASRLPRTRRPWSLVHCGRNDFTTCFHLGKHTFFNHRGRVQLESEQGPTGADNDQVHKSFIDFVRIMH